MAVRCHYIVICGFTLLSVVVLFVQWARISKYTGLNATSFSMKSTIVEENWDFANKATYENSAYVFLSLGVQSNQMNCASAIESLVKYGGWQGSVYLITDRPHCWDRKSIVEHSKIDPTKLHIERVIKDFGSGGFDLSHSKVGSRKRRIESFAMKLKIFDYLPPHIITAAFADCDILFGVKDCPLHFINAGPDWMNHKIKFSRLQRHPDGTLYDIHCGTIVAHRYHSREVMKDWRKEILTFKADGDNDAFMNMYHREQKRVTLLAMTAATADSNTGNSSDLDVSIGINGTGQAVGNKYEPGWLRAVGQGTEEYYELFFSSNMIDRPRICMTHISKARCNTYGRTVVQKYVDAYFGDLLSHGGSGGASSSSSGQLPPPLQKEVLSAPTTSNTSHPSTQQGQEQGQGQQPKQRAALRRRSLVSSSGSQSKRVLYCPSEVIMPFMYGWFPVSYIPFCPKVETIM